MSEEVLNKFRNELEEKHIHYNPNNLNQLKNVLFDANYRLSIGNGQMIFFLLDRIYKYNGIKNNCMFNCLIQNGEIDLAYDKFNSMEDALFVFKKQQNSFGSSSKNYVFYYIATA